MDNFTAEFNKSQINYEGLAEIRQFAARENDNDPILRENTAAIYRTILSMKRPTRILEAGTSIGYSALVAAETLSSLNVDFRIDTVEIDEDTAEKAKKNFEKFGFSDDKIHLILGDSVEIFSMLSGKYDLILLDSSKGHYIDMLPDCKRLLNVGGILFADDIVFYGKTMETPENSPHKHRTIVSRLREFTDAIKNDSSFAAFIDETDDGILVATKLF